MQDDRRRVAALPRRLVLKALAAAPAALAAGCAAVSAEQAPDGGGPTGGGPGAVAPARAADEALAAIRGFPLAPDAEPAFVFRAGAVRPGDPR